MPGIGNSILTDLMPMCSTGSPVMVSIFRKAILAHLAHSLELHLPRVVRLMGPDPLLEQIRARPVI